MEYALCNCKEIKNFIVAVQFDISPVFPGPNPQNELGVKPFLMFIYIIRGVTVTVDNGLEIAMS